MTDLTINGDTFRVEVDGDASSPALLLSNSLGTDLSLWDGQIPALTKHFRVIRYDSRGHGASVAGPGPYSIDQLGRDALAILDALGIETAHVMGLSMGGAVAQWLMINAPERVSRGVLASTTPRFMTPDVWNGRIATVLRDGMDAVAAATMERWFGEDFRKRAPERVAAIEAAVRSTPAQGYAACGAALRDMDLREAIRAIEHPVLVVTGADDPAISAQDTAHVLEAIAGSRHVELPTRHISNVEADAAFTQAALDFLLAELPVRRAARSARPTAPRPTKTPARRQTRRSSAARGPLPARTTAETGRHPRGQRVDAASGLKRAEPSAAKPATKSPAKSSVPTKSAVQTNSTAATKAAVPTKAKMPSKAKPETKQGTGKSVARSASIKMLASSRPAKPDGRTVNAKTTPAKPAAAAPVKGTPTKGTPTNSRSANGRSTESRSKDGKSAGPEPAGVRSAAAKSVTKASSASTRRGTAPAATAPASTARRTTTSAAKPARSAASTGKITARDAKPAAPRRTAASLAAKAMRPNKGANTKQRPGDVAAKAPRAATAPSKAKAVTTKASKSAAPGAQASKPNGRRKPGRPPSRRGAK